jgi:hypothetical protein
MYTAYPALRSQAYRDPRCSSTGFVLMPMILISALSTLIETAPFARTIDDVVFLGPALNGLHVYVYLYNLNSTYIKIHRFVRRCYLLLAGISLQSLL